MPLDCNTERNVRLSIGEPVTVVNSDALCLREVAEGSHSITQKASGFSRGTALRHSSWAVPEYVDCNNPQPNLPAFLYALKVDADHFDCKE